MAAHTKIDLYQMQSLPLDAKIRMTARRIDAFIDRNDAYLSISGGKDSRVLDDIEAMYGTKLRNLTGRQPVLTLDKSINEPTER